MKSKLSQIQQLDAVRLLGRVSNRLQEGGGGGRIDFPAHANKQDIAMSFSRQFHGVACPQSFPRTRNLIRYGPEPAAVFAGCGADKLLETPGEAGSGGEATRAGEMDRAEKGLVCQELDRQVIAEMSFHEIGRSPKTAAVARATRSR